MNSKISNKDKKDWENFLSKDEILPNKDNDGKISTFKKTSQFDLHGYSLDEANIKIKELITDSYNNGIKKLTIVTGKGLHSDNEKNPYVSKDLGILKHSVPEYIKNNDFLMSMINEIKSATTEDGGSGSFYIFLRNKYKK